jgi:hypothetical protein
MTTTTTATPLEAKAYRLTGITSTSGQCDACSRELTQRVFSVAHKTTGATLDLGRRCAAKATGYPTTRIEREAAVALRVAEMARRREIIAAEFPVVAEAWAARTPGEYGTKAAILGDTASTEDMWWNGRQGGAYATWQEYLTVNLENV